MCAIFQLEKADIQEIQDICEDITQKYGSETADTCFDSEIYPQKPAVVVGGEHKVALMRWGFSLSANSKVVFNARSEELMQKRMFRPVLHNRCAVPATAFYEFGSDHKKRRIRMPGVPFFYLAALWRLEKGEDGSKQFRFTVLTTQPNGQIAAFHNRMPVILTPDSVSTWLDIAADTRSLFSPKEEPMRIDTI